MKLNKLFESTLKKKITSLNNDILNEEWQVEVSKAKNDSLGILDGKEIIFEFLEHNEYGCAFEHLTYIINESNIKLNSKQTEEIKKVANELNIKTSE